MSTWPNIWDKLNHTIKQIKISIKLIRSL
uniref:Uncharacterized protein n=1 Tax=Rhizophora mucronata TaxID=61149 RepID=A0A2P2QU20_RHIMU